MIYGICPGDLKGFYNGSLMAGVGLSYGGVVEVLCDEGYFNSRGVQRSPIEVWCLLFFWGKITESYAKMWLKVRIDSTNELFVDKMFHENLNFLGRNRRCLVFLLQGGCFSKLRSLPW